MAAGLRFRLRSVDPGRAAFALSLGAVLARFAASAWVGEDAHITFRTVENLAEGYGLRWNVDERVQTYTHPLWLLLVSAHYLVTRELYTTVTALSLACSVGAFAVLAWRLRERPGLLLCFLLPPVLLSGSLVNFATSGFENPLTHLLLSLFAASFLAARFDREVPWLRLSLLCALAAVNRLDSLLLYAPALAFAGLAGRLRLRAVALGFSPLLAWLLFSLLYYGFPVPNSAPAKLSSALPAVWYARRGLADLHALVHEDPAAGLVLLAGAALTAIRALRFARRRDDLRSGALAALGAGALLYALYVVRIGGDFIVGRFWTAPVWLSLAALVHAAGPLWDGLRRRSPGGRAALSGALVAAALAVELGAAALAPYVWRDAKTILMRSNALVAPGAGLRWEPSPVARRFAAIGTRARAIALRRGTHVLELGTIGFAGLAAGPAVRIVDVHGLGDPLLARLPPRRRGSRIGHLKRDVPAGYLETRASGEARIRDPDLRRYYAHLRRVTSGPLLSAERLVTILRFQVGAYDDLLAAYAARRSEDERSQ